MRIFDTHAHYDDRRFDPDRDAVLSSLKDCGITRVIVPGCDAETSGAAAELARKYDFITPAAGFHPHEAKSYDPDMLDRTQPVIVGEIGLDYHYDHSPRDVQREVFVHQLQYAEKHGLPVIVHDREAHADCLEIIRRFNVRAVWHCYSGSAEYARQLLKLGHFVSFTGSVTFKNAVNLREAAKAIPPDRLMVETDAPYMSPEPHRGKRCDSRYLPDIIRVLAEVRGESAEQIAETTFENGINFFLQTRCACDIIGTAKTLDTLRSNALRL